MGSYGDGRLGFEGGAMPQGGPGWGIRWVGLGTQGGAMTRGRGLDLS